MSKRKGLTILSVGLCLASLWLVRGRQMELAKLRVDQQGPVAQLALAVVDPPATSQVGAETNKVAVLPEGTVFAELLRLRSEVTRLSARKRELASVPTEGEQLRARLTNAALTGVQGTPLPPGYIRKGQARNAGYSTPEDTVQTFLWAVQNHDLAALKQALTPAQVQKLEAELQTNGKSTEEFFKDADSLPGLSVRGRESLSDGSLELEIEMEPGKPSEKLQFQQTNGEWKISSPF